MAVTENERTQLATIGLQKSFAYLSLCGFSISGVKTCNDPREGERICQRHKVKFKTYINKTKGRNGMIYVYPVSRCPKCRHVQQKSAQLKKFDLQAKINMLTALSVKE